MNLPKGYSRCRGEFGFVWEKNASPCDKRAECLRHMQILFDTDNWLPTIQHCINHEAFIPLDKFKEDE